jgi:hypothetical protein
MAGGRKITIEAVEKAHTTGGSGITQTARAGAQPVAASEADARLRQFRGQVRFTRNSSELKADR